MHEVIMPALQVRDLPEDIYVQIGYLAEKEHRSLAQETIVILREGIVSKLGDKERRRKLLTVERPLAIDGGNLPDPKDLVRQDRDR
jgi:plasmid stability protein